MIERQLMIEYLSELPAAPPLDAFIVHSQAQAAEKIGERDFRVCQSGDTRGDAGQRRDGAKAVLR